MIEQIRELITWLKVEENFTIEELNGLQELVNEINKTFVDLIVNKKELE